MFCSTPKVNVPAERTLVDQVGNCEGTYISLFYVWLDIHMIRHYPKAPRSIRFLSSLLFF